LSARLHIRTAEVFDPLFPDARDKAAWGGRGSGKSHFFAALMIEDAMAHPDQNGGEGLRAVCIREVQRDLAQSSKALIEAKLAKYQLDEARGFKVYNEVIRTPGDGIVIFRGMQDATAESIKSLEGFKRAWRGEAQGATQHSINLLRPTMRASGAQMWWSWNPRRKTDAVDMMLRGAELPTGAAVVRANHRDNPWGTGGLPAHPAGPICAYLGGLTDLESVGAELGYSMALMGQANATNILALKAAAWKAKADKYDALQAGRSEAVKAARAAPRVAKPGASPGRAERSARGRDAAWARAKSERSGEAYAALLDQMGITL